MSEYKEMRGSLTGERCLHKEWADTCELCDRDSTIARLTAENERLRKAGITMSRAADRHFESARQLQEDNARLTARVKELENALHRIGLPLAQITYCRDGHEECVLLARAALNPERTE